MRIISFCAEGIEAAAKNGFYDWVIQQDADIICIQDLKAQEYDLQDDIFYPEGYFGYFFDCPQENTNGVAIYCRHMPKAIMTGLGFGEKDIEARYIQADFDDISIGCLLAPEASIKQPQTLEDKATFFDELKAHLVKVRNKRREYVICGSWNMAHRKRDVQDWQNKDEDSGFLPEERRWFEELFTECGYNDAFRLINGDDDEFTWWPEGDRETNGWRTDMQLVSDGLKGQVEYGAIYKNQVFSNHAPVIMDYEYEF